MRKRSKLRVILRSNGTGLPDHTQAPVRNEQVKTSNFCILDALYLQVFGNSETILIGLKEARPAQS